MMEMGMGDRPLLTLSQVRAWEHREEEIVLTVRALIAERDELRRKLEAARVFMPSETVEVETPAAENEPAPASRENLSDAVIEAVAAIGDGAATPTDIRRQIDRANPTLGAKLAASPNYFYTVLNRHLHKGRLVKDGFCYRVPTDSPRGETGAVAAPAPQHGIGQSMEAADNGPKGNGLL